MPPIVALEIGTTKVCALVGEAREDGSIIVIGMGECPSRGVRKGLVIDLENVVTCARAALHTAEESGQVTIEQVYLLASGGNIVAVQNTGSVPVLDPDEGVTDEDIEQVKDVARAVNLGSDRELLHSIAQSYHIDDHAGVVNPRGMIGAKLSLDMLIMNGVRTVLQNALNVVRTVPLDVCEPAFSGLCAALAVLAPEEKRSGAVVIDLGGGTTNYVAYAGGVLADAGGLGVGGDHITNDIVSAFNVPTAQAETLKRRDGTTTTQGTDGGAFIHLKPELGFSGRAIDVRDLDRVIDLRIEEALTLVRDQLGRRGLLAQIGTGIVLTGGGAHLKGIRNVAEQVFSLPCSIGRARNFSGLGVVTERPQYAAPLGLLRYGVKTAASLARGGVASWFRGLVAGR